MTPVNRDSSGDVTFAARTLLSGGLVAFPTETVYGLGADAENEHAVSRIYEVKNRPSDHPLIVHIHDESMVSFWAERIPAYAHKLIEQYWPGPMTLVLPRSSHARDFITGSQETVGLRVPDHPVALRLLTEFAAGGGHGVAAPSANRYGAVSPTSAQAVAQELSAYMADTDVILDGGACDVGVESTIIDCTRDAPVILRPGAISHEMIEHVTRESVAQTTPGSPRVSGSHAHHYSPQAHVYTQGEPQSGHGLIALADVATPLGVVRLASPENLEDYARQLYSALRKADDQGLPAVRVVLPDGDGLAIALRDRIMRSASPKVG